MFDKKKVTMKSAGAASSETLMAFTRLVPNVDLARDNSLSEPQGNHTMHLISSYSVWHSFEDKKLWMWLAVVWLGDGQGGKYLGQRGQQYTGPKTEKFPSSPILTSLGFSFLEQSGDPLGDNILNTLSPTFWPLLFIPANWKPILSQALS